MNCKKCGKEMRIGTEQIGVDERQLPVIHRFAYCDNCREKTDLDNDSTNPKQGKVSTLSVIALIISILGCGCLSVIGLLLATIDLLKKDGRNKVVSIIAVCVSVVWFCVFLFIDTEDLTKNTTEPTTQEMTTEQITEEVTTEEHKITVEEIKEQAVEVNYEDIYRNPETYNDKPIKIVLYVDEYDTAYLGLVDVYYCKADGNDVYVEDYRDVKEPTIASGDTVILYGLGSSMATLTESQKNIIGITTDSEKSKIPSVDMYYVELQ